MNHISWNVTKECNLYCDHCYRESGPGKKMPDELSTEEGKKLLDEIYAAGFRFIVFSGGEPLMRKDIYELIGYADAMGMMTALGTNGTLITEGIADELAVSGLKAAAISIDSVQADKHDRFRGKPGSFNQALEGIKNCVKAGIRVQMNPTIDQGNNDEIIELADLAKRLGVSSAHMLFLVPTGRGKEISNMCMSKEEYKAAINQILNLETSMLVKPTCAPQFMVEALLKGLEPKGSRGCIAGISYCSILPNGDVHICPYTPVKVSNVKELPFDVIWESNEVFKKLRDYKEYKGNCGSCKYINICGGCRGRAYSETGDYLEEDSYCLLERG